MSTLKKDICKLFSDTTLTLQAIADKLGTTYKIVFTTVKANFSKEMRVARKKINYSKSKMGSKNPMKDKVGKQHHNFIGAVSDNKGYMMVLKPLWYTGRKNSKHIFQHHAVYCQANGLTEIPKGYCIHHKDGNKTNNSLDNLLLMSLSDHTKLHWRLRRAETI